jgi:hypothetical protein
MIFEKSIYFSLQVHDKLDGKEPNVFSCLGFGGSEYRVVNFQDVLSLIFWVTQLRMPSQCRFMVLAALTMGGSRQ